MSEQYVKTTADGFVMDTKTGALINTDNNAYFEHKRRIKAHYDNERRLSKLETDMGDIKSMLEQLLKR